MQDGVQDSFGFHESSSSSETFYCRPLQRAEIVDALTCPTPIFASDKGKLDPGGLMVRYPPRHDVAASDCRLRGTPNCSNCYDDPACAMLADLDDIAAISGATPSPYAVTVPGIWPVPSGVPDGDYYVFLEVNKQYDQD